MCDTGLSEQAQAPLRDWDQRPGGGAPRAGVLPKNDVYGLGRQPGCPGVGPGAARPSTGWIVTWSEARSAVWGGSTG